MQSSNDLQILPSSTLHMSGHDASLLKAHVQAHIKPGDHSDISIIRDWRCFDVHTRIAYTEEIFPQSSL